jgi:transcriptional regulator with XRE-family HTH domain
MNPRVQDIGVKVRKLRKEKGLTLADLAGLCGCSSSLISQIETGTVNPSLSTLKTIADVLDISLASLFTTGLVSKDTPYFLMRAEERKALKTQGGVTFELLSRGIDFPCEFILNEFPPGTSTGQDGYVHEGAECGLVLEGELNIEIDGVVHHVEKGDSISLLSSVPHRIWNPGSKKAVAVWVNSVPWLFAIK